MLFDAERILGICVFGAVGPGTLEIAERRTTPRIEQGLDSGVGVLGRVVNLRDVVHRRDAIVELAQRTEQFVDVYVLGPVHGGELQKNVLVIGCGPGGRARAVVDQDPIGEKAAQRRLELVMVGVDKPGHDDAARCVDLTRAARMQVRPNGQNFLALDQHIGLGEVADLRIQ